MHVIWAQGHDDPANDAIAQWIAAHIWGDGRELGKPYYCFGVFRGGKIVGGVAYHDWNPHYGRIEFTGAAVDKRWMTRPVIEQMFSYPFDTLGCQLLIGRNDASAEQPTEMQVRHGFNQYRIPNMRGRGKDEIIVTLDAETWRASEFKKGD